MRYGRTWSPARKNNSARHSRINVVTPVFYAYARTELVARKLV